MTPPTNPDDAAAYDSSFASLSEGFLVGGGRFTLVRMLGRGGMGVVWLARDEQLQESVALKFLPPEIRHDAIALDDLRRETARSRKLTHPNIIRIHDFYKAEHEAFISMEYVDGPSIAELLVAQTDRVFAWNYLLPIVKQLCEALDYAHGERIVHRDLKPANMMLDGRGRLKLADFGIAAVVADSASRVSVRHARSGTSTHMSPQQMDGRLPQVTDDIYALGATLYELLTSHPPFFTGDISHQVRHLAPQPIDERLAELEINNPVPPDVAALIMACLAKDPAQRPQSSRAVVEWIHLSPTTTSLPSPTKAVEPQKRVMRPPTARIEIVPPAPPPPTVPEVEIPTPEPVHEETVPDPSPELEAPPRRNWLPIIITTLALVVVLGGIGAWWFTRHNSGAETVDDDAASEPVASSTSSGERWLLRGHSERVNAVAISRDGTAVASASADNTAILWDARRASIRVTLRAHASDVNAIALSSNATFVITASDDHDVRVWDSSTGVSSRTLSGHTTNVLAVALSPGERVIASSDAAGTIIVWNVTTGARLHTFKTDAGPTRCLAFRDDGFLASAGSEPCVRLWDLNKGKLVKTLNRYKAEVSAMAFTRDGISLITSTRDRSRLQWDAKSFRSWRGGRTKEALLAMSYSPDGSQLATVDSTGTLVLTETQSGQRSTRRIAIDRPVSAIALGDFEFAAVSGETVIVGPHRYRKQESAKVTDAFISLFNGADLSGWRGDTNVWSVVDRNLRGTLAGRTDANHPSCLLWTGGALEDFELRFKFRLLKTGNSGVYYRASELPNFQVGGYQFEIMRGNVGNLIEVGTDRPRRDVERHWFGYNGGEEWREAKITAIGSHIVHECDGRVLCDVRDTFEARPRQGILALEAAGGPTIVEFREIELRRFDSGR